MHESVSPFAALKQRIALLEARRDVPAEELFALGAAPIDARLGGGLAYGRVHEIFAAGPGDGPSAAGFALMLAMRASPRLPIMWLRERCAEAQSGRLHAPGVLEIGLDPARLILGIASDGGELLKAAADSLRCAGIGAAVIEPWRGTGAIDLTISRRLTLAAEQSGVAALLLHLRSEPVPSAAQSRWEVRAAQSASLPADAPGLPAYDVRLLRHRSGQDGLAWRVEWDRDQCSFREAPLPGAVFSLPVGRPAETERQRA